MDREILYTTNITRMGVREILYTASITRVSVREILYTASITRVSVREILKNLRFLSRRRHVSQLICRPAKFRPSAPFRPPSY